MLYNSGSLPLRFAAPGDPFLNNLSGAPSVISPYERSHDDAMAETYGNPATDVGGSIIPFTSPTTRSSMVRPVFGTDQIDPSFTLPNIIGHNSPVAGTVNRVGQLITDAGSSFVGSAQTLLGQGSPTSPPADLVSSVAKTESVTDIAPTKWGIPNPFSSLQEGAVSLIQRGSLALLAIVVIGIGLYVFTRE